MVAIKAFSFVEKPSGFHVVANQDWLTEGLMTASEVDAAIARLKADLDAVAVAMKQQFKPRFSEVR